MALAPATATERRQSPGLQLNLSSNNPFRNRAGSPNLASPASLGSPMSAHSGRPVSTNPFLSAFEAETGRDGGVVTGTAVNGGGYGGSSAGGGPRSSSPQKATFELFDNLALNDRRGSESAAPPYGPPKRTGTMPATAQRRSNEGDRRRGDDPRRDRARPPPNKEDPFASPEKRENRRPRRTNSESSLQRPLTEEEKRARDQRRRERERRHRERAERGDRDPQKDKDKDGKNRESRPRRPGGFDLIDKLDVTGIYGAGLFHHDGPFDAVNPHRNRKKDGRAPMQAFPKDSKNNTLGGSGPINKALDMDRIYGREAEGYLDYNQATEAQAGRKLSFEKDRSSAFDPYARFEPIHGMESSGLGTSTFLEGTPASRTAMQRRDSENDTSVYGNGGTAGGSAGGLTRKKSLAQRIRGMSQPRRPNEPFPGPGHAASSSRGDAYPPSSPDSPPRGKGGASASARPLPGPQSAGGRLGAQQGDTNPFFNEYDGSKAPGVRVVERAEKERPRQRERAPSSPMRGLERRITGEGEEGGAGLARVPTGGQQQGGAPAGGFLGRMKSLKGRKGRA